MTLERPTAREHNARPRDRYASVVYPSAHWICLPAPRFGRIQREESALHIEKGSYSLSSLLYVDRLSTATVYRAKIVPFFDSNVVGASTSRP